ncbi:MAG: hypothetical protein NVS4B2_21790 [Chloroflexota bacterium]
MHEIPFILLPAWSPMVCTGTVTQPQMVASIAFVRGPSQSDAESLLRSGRKGVPRRIKAADALDLRPRDTSTINHKAPGASRDAGSTAPGYPPISCLPWR